jgi:hypothetical protein
VAWEVGVAPAVQADLKGPLVMWRPLPYVLAEDATQGVDRLPKGHPVADGMHHIPNLQLKAGSGINLAPR